MHNKDEDDITHFGFQNVYKCEKTSLVSNIFRLVASKYDLMNDLMSFGIHRVWKRCMVYHSGVYVGCKVLDLAGGTGDLSIQFSRLVGDTGIVVLVDINDSMLHIGRKKIRNLGIINNVIYIQADAEFLPFPENTFDCVAVSFGLRNFTNKEQALFSIHRVLKSRGKLLILDFGVPTFKLLNIIYDLYSFHILPKMGECIAKDTNSYRYLVESIRMHPDQETLKDMIIQIGFKNVKYFNMTGGIAVLHCAYKY
ncbi:bifunctional demethylmenaquinone methyltransferase/2-methoxy-6-polyprenyl-1,4-benzoquinol methylase UbiE [Blochmannia endosymbiont of Camponotus nipponensis]|uniref:bifunctional demethylmenaquinone methyltransferase/2-methoxy-6-polyprenyl-1,4-benzoquinol methylase UbiE n=1 Tax=Blochmannia endosymbiont of Camponotus nipponensis TaxID=2681986 RepID=UPI0015F2E5AA|nr:bifunctional demethylmenaquinone methyltransferase/2-methoxy-6-polyprenyl-1,4-benzoquinol methylase UbiE [Blochmannia endosymbiont of Camponotus nipponensis]